MISCRLKTLSSFVKNDHGTHQFHGKSQADQQLLGISEQLISSPGRGVGFGGGNGGMSNKMVLTTLFVAGFGFGVMVTFWIVEYHFNNYKESKNDREKTE